MESAIEELKLLLAMTNEYLARPLSLQRRLNRYRVTSIAFHDLWYFFKPGDEVRTPGPSEIQV